MAKSQNVNVHASKAHVEPVQLPPFAQLNVHVDPASHVAFGHAEPGPVQTSVQFDPGSHLAFQPPQSPPSEHENTHVDPAAQVTSPEHTAPVELHWRLHIWPVPHATSTPRHVPLFAQL
jgi:hypothetical protein